MPTSEHAFGRSHIQRRLGYLSKFGLHGPKLEKPEGICAAGENNRFGRAARVFRSALLSDASLIGEQGAPRPAVVLAYSLPGKKLEVVAAEGFAQKPKAQALRQDMEALLLDVGWPTSGPRTRKSLIVECRGQAIASARPIYEQPTQDVDVLMDLIDLTANVRGGSYMILHSNGTRALQTWGKRIVCAVLAFRPSGNYFHWMGPSTMAIPDNIIDGFERVIAAEQGITLAQE
ncbi:MAG: hypothetical protein KJ648_07785 [Candidatus Omnitrophica bacterium]|nr:hypothetical protein [Candidatus Omnitrophota bacterium]